MKNFVFGLILIFSLSFTTQTQAIGNDYEKPNISIVDHFDVSIMQVTEDFTFQVGNYQNSQGYNLFDFESGRHYSSIASSRYSKDYSINKGVDIATYFNKEQSSYSKFTQSWRPDRGNLYLRRAEASSTNLQGDHYHSEGDYYRTKGDDYHITKPNELYTEIVFLDRSYSGIITNRINRIQIYKTTIVSTSPIPSGWFRNVTLT